MSRDIKLQAAVRDARVLLTDGKTDTERIFKPAVLTRSRKKALRELQGKLSGLKIDAIDVTDDQEAEVIRTLCDLVSTVLVGAGEVTAGDMLYEAWVAEEITDDQIEGLLDDLLVPTEDPT